MVEPVEPVQLRPETLQAFEDHVRAAEGLMDSPSGRADFLWSDGDSERARHVAHGKVIAEIWGGKGPLQVPAGLIHDWIGAVTIPRTNMDAVLARIQDYNNHKNIYRPEVIDSRLISRDGNEFTIYLRVLKKKIITVVIDTEHHVRYFAFDKSRHGCWSATTRTSEVDDAGKPNESIHPPDTGFGFLWRVNSYWRFQERDGGVVTECRAISLTRDIPTGLKWIIDPIVRGLPKETLIHTLQATRDAMA